MPQPILQNFTPLEHNAIGTKGGSAPALLMLGAEDSDASLVTGLKKRDEAAFTEMVKRHQRLLLSIALRITGNAEDAEDVVQDAFLKVFQNIDRFRGESRFRTWLTRIAINEALMKIRGRPSIWLSLDDDEERGIPAALRHLKSPRYTPEETYSLQEIQALIGGLISQIRLPYQPMMQLCLHMDLSQSEMAKHLRLTLATFKSRLFRARRQLRGALERRCARHRGSMLHVRQNGKDGRRRLGGIIRDVRPKAYLR